MDEEKEKLPSDDSEETTIIIAPDPESDEQIDLGVGDLSRSSSPQLESPSSKKPKVGEKLPAERQDSGFDSLERRQQLKEKRGEASITCPSNPSSSQDQKEILQNVLPKSKEDYVLRLLDPDPAGLKMGGIGREFIVAVNYDNDMSNRTYFEFEENIMSFPPGLIPDFDRELSRRTPANLSHLDPMLQDERFGFLSEEHPSTHEAGQGEPDYEPRREGDTQNRLQEASQMLETEHEVVQHVREFLNPEISPLIPNQPPPTPMTPQTPIAPIRVGEIPKELQQFEPGPVASYSREPQRWTTEMEPVAGPSGEQPKWTHEFEPRGAGAAAAGPSGDQQPSNMDVDTFSAPLSGVPEQRIRWLLPSKNSLSQFHKWTKEEAQAAPIAQRPLSVFIRQLRNYFLDTRLPSHLYVAYRNIIRLLLEVLTISRTDENWDFYIMTIMYALSSCKFLYDLFKDVLRTEFYRDMIPEVGYRRLLQALQEYWEEPFEPVVHEDDKPQGAGGRPPRKYRRP